MADIPLMDFDQFQMHTKRIKDFLDKKGWYYKGGGANYGCLYRNDAPSVVVQNISNTFTASGKAVTIPALTENSLLYVADSDSNISSATVDGGANISVNDINITIAGKTTGDTISLQLGNNAVESYTIVRRRLYVRRCFNYF